MVNISFLSCLYIGPFVFFFFFFLVFMESYSQGFANIAVTVLLLPLCTIQNLFIFCVVKIISRKEIQATLERLKRAESNLTVKERELMEREIKLIEREKTLEQQFKTVVRYPDI